jgi:hypothetical protein
MADNKKGLVGLQNRDGPVCLSVSKRNVSMLALNNSEPSVTYVHPSEDTATYPKKVLDILAAMLTRHSQSTLSRKDRGREWRPDLQRIWTGIYFIPGRIEFCVFSMLDMHRGRSCEAVLLQRARGARRGRF